MPSNLGAQLVKTLLFEVEAIPQDNAVEIKKTTNMTPLNVKVRVRKKDDGPSVMRRGVISLPRNDQPDRPIEKLRLASSDQTIMSFNMVLEADLEKKAARKSKKNFFGICLGAQEDDDDAQYLPSTTSIDHDRKSDTGVMKLKNVRPVVKPVADDIISSNSSRKRDKIFGRCKPGGCLDPPFGEDKYAYQPQPLRSKAPETRIDDAQAIDLQKQTSDKISLKKKQKVEQASEKVADEQNEEKPILNIYQGESGAAIKENVSESIITYPTGLSTSELLVADEKNVARRTSGARNSRKSFNEFSSNEYFSPPRASRDSSKSDKEKIVLTKELLSPRDNKAISPTRFRQSVEKSGSKYFERFGTDNSPGLQDKNHKGKFGISNMADDTLIQKPVLRTTSEGLILELFSDLENDSDTKTWNKTAAGIAAATTAGLVGIGLAANAKKETVTPKEHKENPLKENIQSKDSNDQRSDLGLKLPETTFDDTKADNNIPLESISVDNSANQGDSGGKTWNKTAAEAEIAAATTASLVEIELAAYAKKESVKTKERKEHPLTEDIKSKQGGRISADSSANQGVMVGLGNINNSSENLEETVTQENLKSQGTEMAIKEITPLRGHLQGDLLVRGLETSGDSETNLSHIEKSISQNTELVGLGLTSNAKKENLEPLTEDINYNSENQGETFKSKDTEVTGKINTPVQNQTQDTDISFRGLETTADSEKTLSPTGKPMSQNTVGQLPSTGIKFIGDSQKIFTPLRHEMNDDMDEYRVPTEVYDDPARGSQKTELKDSETGYLPPRSSIKSSEVKSIFKKDFPLLQGTAYNGGNIESIADIESKEIIKTLIKPVSAFQDTEKLTHSGRLSGMTIKVGSDTAYSQKNGEIYKSSEDKIASSHEEALSPMRRVMSEGMERSPEPRSEISNSGSKTAPTSIKSASTVKTLNENETNQRSLRDFTPDEPRLSEGTHGIRHANISFSQASTIRAESITSTASYTESYRKISQDVDNNLLSQNQRLDEGRNDALSTKTGMESFERRTPMKETTRTYDEPSASWPEKSDASVVSDIIKSRSDIIPKYRGSKTLIQSPTIGDTKQGTENTSEQTGGNHDDWGKWGNEGNKEDQFSSPVRVSSHDASGKHSKHSVTDDYHGKTDEAGSRYSKETPHDTSGKYSQYSVTDDSHGKTDRAGSSPSRESIFLNLAFQPYLDENQMSVKTLDSSRDLDLNNVVLVKSLLRTQDKKGITVPLDSKNVMNIVIKPAPPAQNHKLRAPKSITKCDSGKSEYSNSTLSLKNIGSDPHAALSAVFHQELVPLQSLIKSLKDEIESLAARQMMLKNRLDLGTTRSKPFMTKKCACGCLKKSFKY